VLHIAQNLFRPCHAAFFLAVFLFNPASTYAQGRLPTLDGAAPIIIAHRGASGIMPEHTLAGYALAIKQGADYIEPDLVMSKDGHLMVRHDRFLSTSTDVADHAEFQNRKRLKAGYEKADWFVEDFTLKELRSLRAVQPRKARSEEWDGLFAIPTFEEVLELVQDYSERNDHAIGVYPEVKSPEFFKTNGLDPLPPLMRAVKKYGFDQPGSKIFIQCFEPDFLKRLNGITEIPLIQLTAPKSNIALEEIKDYAQGVGPSKALLVDQQGRDNGYVAKAHALGLMVHAWTFRDDELHALFKGEAGAEYKLFLALGIDGLFSDFPATADAIRKIFYPKKQAGQ